MDTQRHSAGSTGDKWGPVHATSPNKGRFPAGEEAWQSNGKWDQFPQPRGWALDWDGFALFALQETYNQHPLAPGTGAPAPWARPYGR